MAVGLDALLLAKLTSIAWGAATEAVDLACGTGRTGAWLKAHGVGAVDGIDITPQMLAIAEAKRVYRRLAVGDEHLAELAPAYREAARLLRPDGLFLLLGYHPFFLMNGLVTHFHRADGEAVTIRSYVHQLSEHFRAGRQAGLALADFVECVIDEAWLKTKPKWQPYLNWPVSFAMVWRKG